MLFYCKTRYLFINPSDWSAAQEDVCSLYVHAFRYAHAYVTVSECTCAYAYTRMCNRALVREGLALWDSECVDVCVM